jgi:hypothetical protein
MWITLRDGLPLRLFATRVAEKAAMHCPRVIHQPQKCGKLIHKKCG